MNEKEKNKQKAKTALMEQFRQKNPDELRVIRYQLAYSIGKLSYDNHNKMMELQGIDQELQAANFQLDVLDEYEDHVRKAQQAKKEAFPDVKTDTKVDETPRVVQSDG